MRILKLAGISLIVFLSCTTGDRKSLITMYSYVNRNTGRTYFELGPERKKTGWYNNGLEYFMYYKTGKDTIFNAVIDLPTKDTIEKNILIPRKGCRIIRITVADSMGNETKEKRIFRKIKRIIPIK